MSKIYQTHRRPERPAGMESRQTGGQTIGNQSMEALMTGVQAPSTENLGHQVDLPGAIREKMENAFSADLSGVQLYESQAVADAGAQAITMGNKIGFAPGKLDLASSGGQSLLGHELSHVVSQARGEVSGNGFLNDHALEARADREGAMAAAGESVYSGPATPLSASSVSSAAGPMQAKKSKNEEEPMQISEPTLVEGPREYNSKSYASSRNAAIAEMVDHASPEQMRDPHLQKLVLDMFNQTMSSELSKFNDSTKEAAFSGTWRGNGAELTTYNKMLKGLSSAHMSDLDNPLEAGDTDAGIAAAQAMVENDDALKNMIVGAKGAFAGSTHYADDDSQSSMLMNNFMLRAVAPQLTNKSVELLESDPGKSSKLRNFGNNMQKSVNAGETDAAKGFRGLAKRLWGKKG